MLSPNCLLGHAEIDVFGQMHSDGGARNFVYGFHSSIVIETAFLLWRIASTCLLMINTFCIISIHRAKQFPSNFRISTLVPDVEAMFIFGWDSCWPRPLLSDVGFFFFPLSSSVLRRRWIAGHSDTTCCGICMEACMRKCIHSELSSYAQQTTQI